MTSQIASVVRGTEETTESQISNILKQWRQSGAPPTVVVCFNDPLASAVNNTAARQGIRIPEDLSLVGFDNDPACETLTPALTSIYPGWAEMGRLGVDLVCDETFWSGAYPKYRITVPAQLKLRDSVAPPAL